MTARTVKPSWPRAIVSLALISLVVLIALAGRGDTAHASSFEPEGQLTFADATPGATSDIETAFKIPAPDANFAGTVGFVPTALGVPRPDTVSGGTVPIGAWVGTLMSSKVTLGLVNAPCANNISVEFTFFNATVNTSDTIDPLPAGTTDALAPLAGDFDKDGIAEIKPPPAVTKYPSYLNTLFPGITPRARYAAATRIPSASLWVILQFVVFEPGTTLPDLPAFDASLGYPSVTVLQDTTIDPAPSAVTDFCSPLTAFTTLFGVTKDNPDIGGGGGVDFRTNPGAGTYNFIAFARSQRDADDDGIENALDPCPFDANTVWDPRFVPPPGQTVPGDSDTFGGQMISDGIPDICDPTAEATGIQPTDHDNDGFLNRGDNCPLVANGVNEDGQLDTDDDGIGDACDTLALGNGPNIPDGHRHEGCATRAVTFPGDGNGQTVAPPGAAPCGDNSIDHGSWREECVIGVPAEHVGQIASNFRTCTPVPTDGGGGGGGDGGDGGGQTAVLATVKQQLLESLVAGLNLTTSIEALAPGGSTVIGAVCADENAQPIPGADITFRIDSQPGSDADLDGETEVTETTDAEGFADTTLNVGSTVGNIVVSASGDAAGCTTKTVTVTVTEQAAGGTGAAGGADTGVGSLAPFAASIPTWAAIASGLGAAGLLGSLGAFATRIIRRRRDD